MLEIDICPRDVSSYRVGQLLGATIDNILCFVCEVIAIDNAGDGCVETIMRKPGGFYASFNFRGEVLSSRDMSYNPIGVADCDFRIVETSFPAECDNLDSALFYLMEKIRKSYAKV